MVTPIKIDDEDLRYNRAYLRVKINDYAIIDKVHVREGIPPMTYSPKIESPIIYENRSDWRVKGIEDELSFALPNNCCTGPIVIL